jgi:hypothetical protein
MGSAINDATRELGGTLGVAVVGSVALSLYRDAFDGTSLPGPVLQTARESIGAAVLTADGLVRGGDASAGAALAGAAQSGFLDGLQAGCLVAAGVSVVGAVLVLLWLPAHPTAEGDAPDGRVVPAAA